VTYYYSQFDNDRKALAPLYVGKYIKATDKIMVG
jgi:hypothetical protein